MSRERTRGFIGYKLDQAKLLERARDIQVATYDMDPVEYMKNHSVEDLVLVMINEPDAYGCAKHAVIVSPNDRAHHLYRHYRYQSWHPSTCTPLAQRVCTRI